MTGVVICTDTGKPARFAEVQLLPAAVFSANSNSGNGHLDLEETATGLDGRFTIEAVPPGDYYAFATLNGYLDPERGIDFNRAKQQDSDDAQIVEALNQWKEHFAEVTVSAQHTSELKLAIERGAEIDGTVSYDDSSPAIGMRFQLLRKTAQGDWTAVGDSGSNWALEEKSDSHGRFRITNLPAGEYKVCTLFPVKSEESAPRVCLGGSFRKKNAEAVKVSDGEIRGGTDIVIPLTGMFTVGGNVAAGMDGHAPNGARIHLLYADDREEARAANMRRDGSFSFDYVPAGDYVLRVADVQDTNTANQNAGSADSSSSPQPAPEVHRYLDKEIPLSVQSDMNDVTMQPQEAPKTNSADQ
ncbi:MAG: hypothetical protein P4K93_13860 [Terracidiphilus sp.]|nr:hypothetical protein [Terracidiphilus sp.]